MLPLRQERNREAVRLQQVRAANASRAKKQAELALLEQLEASLFVAEQQEGVR